MVDDYSEELRKDREAMRNNEAARLRNIPKASGAKGPSDVQESECSCGRKFTPRVLELHGRELFRQRFCDPCTDEHERNEREEQRRTQEKERAERLARSKEHQWNLICPPLYRNTEVSRLSAGILERVLEWEYGTQGLILHGDTGKQKTRLMFQLLRREFDAGKKVVAYGSSDFRTSAAHAAMEGDISEWIERIAKADIFYFDDLGQMKMTESSEEVLLTVIEKRAANMLPIMATTQYIGKELAGQFIREQRGFAITRRLREFCRFIAL